MRTRSHILNYNKRRSRGVILVLTLWMVTVLSLMAYSLAYEMRLELRLTKLKKDNLIAYQLAKAGVAKAVCDLKNDMVIDRAEEADMFDAEGDVWKKPEDKTNIELGDGTYTVRIYDEESRINLNQAHPLVLKALIKYFLEEEEEEGEFERIAMAIQDWRDPDDQPAVNEGTSEVTYYMTQIAKEMGVDMDEDDYDSETYTDLGVYYRLKNDRFTTVEEVLDVFGITPYLYYGFDPEEERENRYDTEEDDRYSQHIMGSGSYDDDLQWDFIPRGFGDTLTVNSANVVNVNTASEAVLTAIIDAAQISDPDPEDMARAIIDYRRGGGRYDVDNDNAFRQIGDLSQVDGLSGPLISRMQSVQRLTVSSTNFRIVAEGFSGKAHRTIETVVTRTYESFNVDANDDYDPEITRRIRRVKEDEDSDRITVESPSVRIIQWKER